MSDDGALLVADEVLTGFGRTGKPFGFQHWDVVPDLITVAKGLASGYATIGAVIVHERIAKHFDDNVLACGLTYYAHPTACAAAVETMKVYDDEQHVRERRAARPGAAARAQAIRDAIQSKRLHARARPPRGARARGADRSMAEARRRSSAKRKLSLHVDGKRGTAIFAPPLCITEQELVTGVRSFGEAARLAFGSR